MHLSLPSSTLHLSHPSPSFSLLTSPRKFSIVIFNSTMKLAKIIPAGKNLFKSKKSRSLRSESDPLSFSSSTTSSSEEIGFKKPDGLSTPTSVLPTQSISELSEISVDMYSELKQAFEMIDRDGDGKIQKEELESLLSRLGAVPPSKEELNLMVSEIDIDGDGCITLEEFQTIGSAFAPPTCDSELQDAFDFFDTNRDGKITAEELFNGFKTIGDLKCTLDDCRRMIAGVDQSGDGFVCFEDFSLMMEHQQRI